MKIQQRIVDNVAIVDLTGDLSANRDGELLTDKVRSLIQQGYLHIVVDLGNVPYMDSSGLGELVQTLATTRKAGGELTLMRVTRRLQDLLAITKLVTVFDTYEDEASALANFTTRCFTDPM